MYNYVYIYIYIYIYTCNIVGCDAVLLVADKWGQHYQHISLETCKIDEIALGTPVLLNFSGWGRGFPFHR